jgi:hypothetical protein
MSWADLPADVARCLGRRDFSAETDTCPVRNGCKRYLCAVEGRFGSDGKAPYFMWMCTSPVHEKRLPVDGGAS